MDKAASVVPGKSYDVVVAGAGTGGCGAAIQAARMGASVLLVEETDWIGGQMNAAAVTSMDEGSPYLRESGLYRELCERIEKHYRGLGVDCLTAYWHRHICTEPRVGQWILREMLAEAGKGGEGGRLDVVMRAAVVKVAKEKNAVTGVTVRLETGAGEQLREVACRVLIDATEWGDVIPLAGARYRVGNCLSEKIDERQKVQMATWTAVYRQYPEGVPGELVMKAPPPGYTPEVAAGFARTLVAGEKVDTKAKPWNVATFVGYRGMPDGARKNPPRVVTRTHLNYNNDYPMTVGEVEDPAKREATCRGAQLKTLHLLYYLQEAMKLKDWAIANDEGYDTQYNRERVDRWLAERPELRPYRAILVQFPVMPYVRESRRIVGLHTLTAREVDRRGAGPKRFASCVALGDYAVDLHGAADEGSLERELERVEDRPPEGQWITGLFTIPFECFIPETLDGFVPAEKNISQSRLANGATRLQPSTLLMGQAAGTIAALAVRRNVPPRRLDPVLVQQALLEAGVMLDMMPLRDVVREAREWKAIQLVGAAGMMTAEGGRFRPGQALTRGQLGRVLGQLTGKAADLSGKGGEGGEAVTREEFARALGGASEKVTVRFSAQGQDAGKEITRSEAAQVLAEFLRLRAEEKVGGGRRILTWDAVLPATPEARVHSPALPAADLERLLAAGVIDSAEYWRENAVEGGQCDGGKVGQVIARGARRFRPESKPEEAVKVLVEQGVISSREYWGKSAVAGSRCAGEFVAVLLRGLARELPAGEK